MDGTGDTDRWAVSVSRHPPPRILTINTGSSSLKTALYDEDLKLKARGTVERIGLPGGRLAVADAAGRTLAEERGGFADHGAALHALLPRLLGPERAGIPAAIGHRDRPRRARVRRRRPRHRRPARRAAAVGADRPRAPAPGDRRDRGDPSNVSRTCRRSPASTPPSTAGCPASPSSTRCRASLAEAGVIRYGFHGLSYESIVGQLRALGDADRRAAGS